MNATKSDASTSSTDPPDPLTLCPVELLPALFKSSSSNDLIRYSCINQHWRRKILSTSSLFHTLTLDEVDDYGKFDEGITPNAIQLAANRTIGRILRYEQLSNHGLVEVDLVLQSFYKDPALSFYDWGACKLSLVFNILTFSSHSLKTLSLDLKPPSHSDQIHPFKELNHLVCILESLKHFKQLTKIKILTNSHIELQSESSHYDLQIASHKNDHCFEEHQDAETGYLLVLDSIRNQFVALTNHGLKKISLNIGTDLGDSWSELLTRSRDSLKIIKLVILGDFVGEDVNGLAPFLDYPNLVELDLICRRSRTDDELGLGFVIPPGENYESKLQKVSIRLSGMCSLCLNQEFFRWIGRNGTLKELNLQREHHHDNSWALWAAPLRAFLFSSSLTLVSLCLEGFYLSYNVTESLKPQLHQLRNLKIGRGNHFLMRFFTTKVVYSSLKTLSLTLPEIEGNEEGKIHREIVEVLRSCQKSLESVKILSYSNVGEPDHPEDEPKKEIRSKSRPLFALANLSSITLIIEDRFILDFYLKISYPKLLEGTLPSSTKISLSSFSISPIVAEVYKDLIGSSLKWRLRSKSEARQGTSILLDLYTLC